MQAGGLKRGGPQASTAGQQDLAGKREGLGRSRTAASGPAFYVSQRQSSRIRSAAVAPSRASRLFLLFRHHRRSLRQLPPRRSAAALTIRLRSAYASMNSQGRRCGARESLASFTRKHFPGSRSTRPHTFATIHTQHSHEWPALQFPPEHEVDTRLPKVA